MHGVVERETRCERGWEDREDWEGWEGWEGGAALLGVEERQKPG